MHRVCTHDINEEARAPLPTAKSTGLLGTAAEGCHSVALMEVASVSFLRNNSIKALTKKDSRGFYMHIELPSADRIKVCTARLNPVLCSLPSWTTVPTIN